MAERAGRALLVWLAATGAAAQDGPMVPVRLAPPAPQVALRLGPQEVVLNTPTPAEAQAHGIWTLRAALNVAALQCQFSPFLATVNNYNDFLRHHARDLSGSLTTMTAHFKRVDGPRTGVAAFDRYTTRTYNSFSTLDAQLRFCAAAAEAGRAALFVGKGKLGVAAQSLNPALRQSLTPDFTDNLRLVSPDWADAALADVTAQRR